MLAIEYGYTDVINRLVEHRIGLDATDQVRHTALKWSFDVVVAWPQCSLLCNRPPEQTPHPEDSGVRSQSKHF